MKQISETELVLPTLQYLNSKRGGYAKTSELIEYISDRLKPTGRDLEILSNRNDTRISQKVRNMVCHRNSRTSFIKKGLAVYRDNGLEITALGRQLI